MKRILSVICTFVLLTMAITVFGGCSQEKQVNQDSLKGYWGRDGEVICEFSNNNKCNIGGVYGIYNVSAEKTLDMKTGGDGYSYTFTWVDSAKDINEKTWNITDDTLIIGGMQYMWIDPKNVEIETNTNTSSETQVVPKSTQNTDKTKSTTEN